MPIERPHVTSYVLAIAMFVLSVIICEVITYKLTECIRFESLTLKMNVKDVEYFDEN